MSRILCFTVGLCGLLALVARPAHPSQEDFAQRFRVRATSRTETLQTELNQAAAASYQFRAAWSCASCGWDSLFVLLEKSTDPSVAREFRVLGVHKTTTLRRELYEAGREGFRLLPGGMFKNVKSSTSEGLEVVMLLERLPDAAQQYDYLLVDPPTRVGFLDGVDLLEDRGYRIEGLAYRNSHHVLVGTKPTDGGPDSNQAIPRIPYQLVTAAHEVDQAAADGYRLVMGLSRWDLVMEQISEPGRPYKYLVLPGVDTETLQFDMNAAGARGFQLHPRTIFGLNGESVGRARWNLRHRERSGALLMVEKKCGFA